MHCHICDADIATPNFSSDHGTWDPCGTCLAVVKDTLEGFLDKPVADEDELGGPADLSDYIDDYPEFNHYGELLE